MQFFKMKKTATNEARSGEVRGSIVRFLGFSIDRHQLFRQRARYEGSGTYMNLEISLSLKLRVAMKNGKSRYLELERKSPA
jgi:hypothetical protein